MNFSVVFTLLIFSILQCYAGNSFLEDCPLRLNDNPNAPLVGIGEFSTSSESKIRVEVLGENPIVTNFDEYKTEHRIPVFGLYLNKENMIRITATSRSGAVAGQNCTLNTEFFPDIPEITVMENQIEEGSQTRLYFVSSGDIRSLTNFIMDTTGAIRYYWPKGILIRAQIKNKNFLATFDAKLHELDVLGNIVKKLDHSYVHHSLIQLANKNFAFFQGTFFIEVDHNTQQEVSRIDLFKLPCLRPPIGSGYLSPTHHNWIAYDKNDDTFLLSLRDQAAVYKINAETKEVKWILGYPYKMDMLDNSCRSKFFTSSMIPREDWFSGQHSAILLPNRNIAVFDNHANAEFITIKEIETRREAGEQEVNFIRRTNRILEYSIDEKNQTADLVWRYEPPEKHLRSTSRGSVRYLPKNNHYLALFPAETHRGKRHGFLVEINRGSKEVIFKARIEMKKEAYYSADLFDVDDIPYLTEPEEGE